MPTYLFSQLPVTNCSPSLNGIASRDNKFFNDFSESLPSSAQDTCRTYTTNFKCLFVKKLVLCFFLDLTHDAHYDR